jgi:diguanylate cyclase (GGDEF)-like protein
LRPLDPTVHNPVALPVGFFERPRAALLIPPLTVLAAAHLVARAPAPAEPWRTMLAASLPVTLGGAALLGLLFNRGRVVLAALALGVAAGIARWAAIDPAAVGSRTTRELSLAVLALGLAALGVLGERGRLGRRSVWRALPLVAPLLLAAWWTRPASGESAAWARAHLDRAVVYGLDAVTAAAALAGAVVLLAVFRRGTPIEAALAGSLVGLVMALGNAAAPHTADVYLGAGGLALAIGLILESHRLAFQDELTGLPGRRALNEALPALAGRYVIAMIDVDHFKKFNDDHGHDVGDQVLRLVASRLRAVGGGGQPFRYGGEEFAVVFPGRGLDEVREPLEALRATIEASRLTLRGKGRPRKKPAKPKPRRGTRQVWVTVSIGAAEADERRPTPQKVIEGADRALYRAKENGRNQVAV